MLIFDPIKIFITTGGWMDYRLYRKGPKKKGGKRGEKTAIFLKRKKWAGTTTKKRRLKGGIQNRPSEKKGQV